MKRADFEHAIQRGLGRVILYLQKHPSAPYRDLILKYCLHCSIFDRQIEGSRNTYLLEIIELTGETMFYRDQILAQLARLDDTFHDYDITQTFELASKFALNGDKAAEQDILTKFDENPSLGRSYAGAVAVVCVKEGLQGLLYAADKLPESAYEDVDWETGRHFLAILEDDYSEAEVFAALDEAGKDNPRIRAYTQALRKELTTEVVPSKRERQQISSFAKLQTYVAHFSRGRSQGLLNYWGKHAQPEELAQAAQALLAEADENRLWAYLLVFTNVPFPLDFSRLLTLVEGTNNDLARAAIYALANTPHPSVRELALRLIQNRQHLRHALELLKKNLQEQDWELLAELATHLELDNETYHGMGLSLRNIVDENPHPRAATALLQFYENTPCSHCREGFVRHLHDLGQLPDVIRQECLFDSNLDLRERAKKNFEDVPQPS